jgi:hypothetical protein
MPEKPLRNGGPALAEDETSPGRRSTGTEPSPLEDAGALAGALPATPPIAEGHEPKPPAQESPLGETSPAGVSDTAPADGMQVVAYQIEAPHPMLASDDQINHRLREAGLTQNQAQLVYDLAGEILLPLIEEVAWQGKASKDLARLSAEFGGAEAWQRTAEQLRTWGKSNLAPQVYAALAADPDGIHAMHQMMRSKEPALIGQTDANMADLDEVALNEMVRDPRYWRDRDPEFVTQVSAGFQKLYRR